MKWALALAAGIALAACSGPNTAASPTTTGKLAASSSSTASPAAVTAHFVTPDPSTAKIAVNQSGADLFSDFIGIHEVGLRAGQTVTYHAAGNASANYACNRTDGTLDSAPGSQQVATARADVREPFVADTNGEVIALIIVAPARPNNPVCPPGYAIAMWRSSYASMTVTDETNSVTWNAPDSSSQAN